MRWPREVTPELFGHVKHRYEETDETVKSIAADTEIPERRIYTWVVQHKWRRRRDRPPRDLPPELRLKLDADRALEEMDVGAGLKPAPTDSAVPSDGEADLQPAAVADDAAPAPADALSVAERLERQLERNLARVERLREAQWPQSTADAERTTRALERLTAALLKVRQLQNPDTNTNTAETHDFDIPGDIDEFRRALARRIEAFVRSRTGGGVSGPGEAGDAG